MGRSDSVFTLALILDANFPAIRFTQVGRVPPLARTMSAVAKTP